MAIQEGAVSGNLAEVDDLKNSMVKSPGMNPTGTPVGGGNANANAMFSENDDGVVTGERLTLPPETDDDYRLRVALDTMLDDETFNYTAQNVKKHQVHNTTMTAVYTSGGLIFNGGNITTASTGVRLQTYATFPFLAGGNRRIDQWEWSFSGAVPANTIVRFGSGLTPNTNPFTPTDGCYWEISSAGVQGFLNHNGTLVPTGIMQFLPNPAEVNKFMATISNNKVTFWVNDQSQSNMIIPLGQAQPFMSTTLPFFAEQVIAGGTAGGTFQATCKGYSASIGGSVFLMSLSEFGSMCYGDYQGLSGGVMGSLMAGTVTSGSLVNPTAAAPTNTAPLVTGLGGIVYETVTLAAGVDGILMSYQVPAATVNSLGKRLKVTGFHIASFIQTAITGGPYIARFFVGKGATAATLVTVDAANTKAPVRVMTPIIQAISAGQAVSTLVTQSNASFELDNAIYVNPGEFFQILTNHVGTIPTAGVISHQISLDYTWV